MNIVNNGHKKIECYIDEYNHYIANKLQESEDKFKKGPTYPFVDTSSSIFGIEYFGYIGLDPDSDTSNTLQHEEYIKVASAEKIGSTVSSTPRIFFVIPSFFNSPSILHFDQQNNFIKILQSHGEVFLLHWLESNKSYIIDDLIDGIIAYINDNFIGTKIDIVGHCIGGVIAASVTHRLSNRKLIRERDYIFSREGYLNRAMPPGSAPTRAMPNSPIPHSPMAHSPMSCNLISSNSIPSSIASLTLLTCSWDFSHFKSYIDLMECLALDKQAKSSKFIPRAFIQIMFFMLNPMQFKCKMDKYFAGCGDTKARILKVEHWLQSGINLPTSLYTDLMDNVIKKNISIDRKNIYCRSSSKRGNSPMSSNCKNNTTRELFVGDQAIDPDKLEVPTFISYCKNDHIVPKKSVMPLIEGGGRNKTVIELPGGHISYLVSNIEVIQRPYEQWLRGIINAT